MTDPEKYNSIIKRKPRLLVAPLDWGIGHASRCVPLIANAIDIGFEVIIAASGPQAALLAEAFPNLLILPIPGYHMKYALRGWANALKIASQIPKILTAIKKEKTWLSGTIKIHKIDAILSDNRFGLYDSSIRCIFITHQLQLQTGVGKIANAIATHWNLRQVEHFHECWVPDVQQSPGLGGELSHPHHRISIPLYWIGPLSRLSPVTTLPLYDLLVLLSGPEPQRTLLEKKLVAQLRNSKRSVLFLRGLPGETQERPPMNNVEFRNHLGAAELSTAVAGSEIVLSRPGYSSIMDLLPLHKKCVFIPTPGQGEQEYLAKNLAERYFCILAKQDDFDLELAINDAKNLVLKPFSAFSEESRSRLLQVFKDLVENPLNPFSHVKP